MPILWAGAPLYRYLRLGILLKLDSFPTNAHNHGTSLKVTVLFLLSDIDIYGVCIY
jgi:hypothetical protein